MRRPCEDTGLVWWSEQDEGCPRPIMVGNAPQGCGSQELLCSPRGALGLGERGPRRSCELRGGVAIAPQRPGGEVQAILTPSWTSVPSSRPCPVPDSPGGTVWRQRSRWRREEGGSGRGRSPAQRPPRFPYLHIGFILALCLCYPR